MSPPFEDPKEEAAYQELMRARERQLEEERVTGRLAAASVNTWALIGQTVLWGDRGLYRVLDSRPGPQGWLYRLESLDAPAGVLEANVPALRCRVLPKQPVAITVETKKARKRKAR